MDNDNKPVIEVPVAEPTYPEQGILTPEPTPAVPESAAEDMAVQAATIADEPFNKDYLKQQTQEFLDTGESKVTASYEMLYYSDATTKLYIDKVKDKAAELGVAPVTVAQVFGSQFSNEAEQEALASKVNPQAHLYFQKLLDDMNHPDFVDGETMAMRREMKRNSRTTAEFIDMQRDEIVKEAQAELARYSDEEGFEDKVSETIGGLLVELIPGYNFVRTRKFVDTVSEDGIPLISLSGGMMEELRAQTKDAYNNDPDKFLTIMRNIRNFAGDQSMIDTDFGTQYLFGRILTDKTLNGQVEDSTWLWSMEEGVIDVIINNAIDVLDATFLTSIVGRLGRAATASAAFGATWRHGMGASHKAANAYNKSHLNDQLLLTWENPTWQGGKSSPSPHDIAGANTPHWGRYAEVKDDIPDVTSLTAAESARVQHLRSQVAEIVENTEGAALTGRDKQYAVRQLELDIQNVWGGRARPGRSSLIPHDDGNGVKIQVMIGGDTVNGMTERAALELAEQYTVDGTGVRIYNVEFGKMRPYSTGREAMSDLEKLRSGKATENPGEYYVELAYDYYFRPDDKLLFGDYPVLSPAGLGRAGRHLLTPSAQFSPEVYSPFVANVLSEQALSSSLDRIVTPLFQMSRDVRRNVGEIYDWTYTKSIEQNGKPVSISQIRERFPDVTADELHGYSLLREFYRTLYDVQNQRLYKDYASRGYKTLTNNEGTVQIHGEPLKREYFKTHSRGGTVSVYDPVSGSTRKLKTKDINTIYNAGGSIIRTDLPISAGDKAYHKLVLFDNEVDAFRIRPLNQNPLKRYEGYYPRMYEDHYYINRTVRNATLDGQPHTQTHTVRIAGTKKEAEEFVRRMNAKYPDQEWSWSDGARFSTKDRIAKDLEAMQVEGRLFFDDRQNAPLMNINGTPADIVDPVNMVQRSSRMVSRQVAVEDLVKSMKNAFGTQYGHLLEKPLDQVPASQVHEQLKHQMLEGETDTIRKQASDALNLWDYIRVQEGNMDNAPKWFRRQAVAAAEFVHETMHGVKGFNRPSTWLFRNAHKAAPIETAKQLAFIDFIVTRPVRQVALQASQHLFVQSIAPEYIGRMQRDMVLLLEGAKRTSLAQAYGKDVGDFLVKRNATMMGLTEEEYLTLVHQFEISGNLQSVNMHSLAGDLPKATTVTPLSKAGDVAQTAWRTATAAPVREGMQRYGFDLGEQLNLSGSYMLAIHEFKKSTGKTIGQFTKDDWKAISIQGNNYALSMNRANSPKWQTGIFSLPLQFMSFTQKTLLTGIRGMGKTGAKYGNKAVTTLEARKILAGQMLLFGGAGFGLKDWASEYAYQAMEAAGLVDHPQAQMVGELLASGMLDMSLDMMLTLATSDDTDLAWDEYLAPGGNILQTAQDYWDAAWGQPILETAMGASGATTSRILQGVQLAHTIMNYEVEGRTDAQRLSHVKDELLAGAFSGYSDYYKAKLAYKTGHWIDRSGNKSAWTPTMTEILAKGIAGLNSERYLTEYKIRDEGREYQAALKHDATTMWKEMQRVAIVAADGEITSDDMIAKINYIADGYKDVFDEEEWMYVLEIFQELEHRNQDGRRDSVGEYIVRAFGTNLSTPDSIVSRLPSVVPEDERAELLELLRAVDEQIKAEAKSTYDLTVRGMIETEENLKRLEEQ